MTDIDRLSVFPGLNDAVHGVLNRLSSQQAILVVAGPGFKADLYLYQRHMDKEKWWIRKQMPATVGLNGMGKAEEGDGKSPCGIFPLGLAFGLLPKAEGAKYPYRLLTPDDYWVDDSRSKDYHKWVHYHEGDPKDWQSAERLGNETICYRYALVINYNPVREAGKGSAIFLHVWRNENAPTHGCTAVSEGNMRLILQWLDQKQAPVLIQGAPEDLKKLAEEME